MLKHPKLLSAHRNNKKITVSRFKYEEDVKMSEKSIVTKLFAITALLLLIFFSMQFIFQCFWLEKFYAYNKNKRMIQKVVTLNEKLEEK